MNKVTVFCFIILSLAACSRSTTRVGMSIEKQINYGTFLAQQDVIFDTVIADWTHGAFVGNGVIGAMLYREDSSSLRFDVSRTDVADHRDNVAVEFGKYRLPIGKFVLKGPGPVSAVYMRLKLYEAEVSGYMVFGERDTATFQLLAHAQTDLLMVRTGGNVSLDLAFLPEESVSPRVHYRSPPEGYMGNPSPSHRLHEDVSFVVQARLSGGDYTTAWKQYRDGPAKICYINISDSYPERNSADKARRILAGVGTDQFDSLISGHRRWWDEFYRRSFLSVPDKRMESFWWIQQYKMGSATRAGLPAIDVMGPWYRKSPWAAYWWNLNVQLTYSPMYSSNRTDLSMSLVEFLNDNTGNLILNVPEKYRHNSAAIGRITSLDGRHPIIVDRGTPAVMAEQEMELGNLTWALHNYYQQYRYTMDTSLLPQFYPLLRRSVQYYLNITEEDNEGLLHLPVTYSPEYPGGFTRDCNYDLSLFHWGLQTLLELNDRYQYHDTLAIQWQQVKSCLTKFPQDENGFRIGKDVPFNQSHRHYSHLLMVYPLALVTGQTPSERELILKSLRHWHSFPSALQGYSFTGGASILASLGMGNEAYNYLNTLLDKFVRPNTMYLEAGPVIETPLAAVTSINELVLNSRNGTLLVFPAVPGEWKDVAFHNLRAPGAFLISGERKNGITEWIRITSLSGEPCRIVTDIVNTSMVVDGLHPGKVKHHSGYIEVVMARGQSCTIKRNRKVTVELKPVPAKGGNPCRFGVRKDCSR